MSVYVTVFFFISPAYFLIYLTMFAHIEQISSAFTCIVGRQ